MPSPSPRSRDPVWGGGTQYEPQLLERDEKKPRNAIRTNAPIIAVIRWGCVATRNPHGPGGITYVDIEVRMSTCFQQPWILVRNIKTYFHFQCTHSSHHSDKFSQVAIAFSVIPYWVQAGFDILDPWPNWFQPHFFARIEPVAVSFICYQKQVHSLGVVDVQLAWDLNFMVCPATCLSRNNAFRRKYKLESRANE